ncbi:MAG: 50S ribosomal protein L30e [Candidatus Thorarchaeota archaeon]
MSFNQSVAIAVRTGKCHIGTRSSIQATRNGTAKLVIVSGNCPSNESNDIERYARLANVPVYKYSGSSWELGELIGKPFMVSAIAIIDPGDSKILNLI